MVPLVTVVTDNCYYCYSLVVVEETKMEQEDVNKHTNMMIAAPSSCHSIKTSNTTASNRVMQLVVEKDMDDAICNVHIMVCTNWHTQPCLIAVRIVW